MYKKILFGFFVLLLLGGCSTNTANVYPVSVLVENSTITREMVKNKSQGFFYSLPKTALNVSVSVKKVAKKPSLIWKKRSDVIAQCFHHIQKIKNSRNTKPDFKLLSDCEGIIDLLRSEDAVSKYSIKYSIADISISTITEPDPVNQFYIEISDDSFTANSLKMTLAELGMLSNVGATTEDKSLDYAVAGLKVTASITGAFFGFGSVSMPFGEVYKATGLPEFVIITPVEFEQVRALYQKYIAEVEAYGKFLTFRDVKQAAMSKEMYDIAKSNYETRINEYKAMFVGSKTEKTKTFTFKYSPRTSYANATDEIKICSLFNNIKYGGVIYPDNKELRFTQKVFAVSNNTKDLTDVYLNISPAMDNSTQRLDRLSAALCVLANKDSSCPPIAESLCPSPPCGLAYRIPGTALVTVTAKGKVLESNEVLIAQSGLVAYLPRTIEGSESGLEAEYYGGSGALKSISITKTLPEASSVSAVGDAAASAMGVFDKTKNLQNAAAQATAKADIAAAKYNEAKAKYDLQNMGESFTAGSGEEE